MVFVGRLINKKRGITYPIIKVCGACYAIKEKLESLEDIKRLRAHGFTAVYKLPNLDSKGEDILMERVKR